MPLDSGLALRIELPFDLGKRSVPLGRLASVTWKELSLVSNDANELRSNLLSESLR